MQQNLFAESAVANCLAQFLAQKLGAEVRIQHIKRFVVGFSWLTFGFDAAWCDAVGSHHQEFILRIGSPDGLFAPYKASPEFFALQSLQNTSVPLPRVYWYSDASNVFDAPFFICEKMEGDAPVPWVAAGQDFADAERAILAEQFVAALVAIHNFEWRGTPVAATCAAVIEQNAASKQIEFWEELLRRSGLRRFPAVAWALAWLRANAPVAPKISIVHGDYRIGNFLEKNGRITAILDWELVHLGDPHEDLGFVCLRAFRGGTPYLCRLISRDDLYRRYEELSGMAVSPHAVHYYEVLNNFKVLAIHAAATGRFEMGGNNDVRLAAMGAQIPRLLLQLEKMVETLT